MASGDLEQSVGLHNIIFPRLSGPDVMRSDVDKDFLENKYIKEGLSCQEIASLIGGITRQGVWKALKRNGIKTRNKQDSVRVLNGEKCRVSQGYFWIYQPGHPRANGKYVKRCVLVLEKKIGRFLLPGEFPHHLDENRLNDDPSNLEVTTRTTHFRQYHKGLGIKGRIQDPSRRHKRFCANDVLQIKKMYRAGEKMSQIARFFKVGRTAIHDIIYGKCWGYVKE